MLELININFGYNHKPIIKEINISVQPGKILSLLGPNGAGKSTLLKCILGLNKPFTGEIKLDGKSISCLSKKEISQKIGYVPQQTYLKFPVSVFEMVLRGRRPYMNWRPSKTDIDITVSILKEMKLLSLASKDINVLSGGQIQKILLARAFVQNPSYLLLDEPTNNLDIYHQLEVMEMIRKWAKEKKLGVVMAMHELSLAINYSDEIVMMKHGRILKKGSPSYILTPKNIKEIYGIDAKIHSSDYGIFIQPIKRSFIDEFKE